MKSSKIGSIETQPYLNSGFLDISCSISAQKVTRFLLWVVTGLVCLSIVGDILVYSLPDFPMRDFFEDKFALNEEHNFPTLYSSLALFLCAVILWIIARFKSECNDRYTLYWTALSAVFVYLSIDELLSIHEAFSKPMHNLGVNGLLHNAWVVPGFVVVGIFLVLFSRFFFHLPTSIKRLFAIAFVLFIGGAFIMEIIDGYYKFLYGEKTLGYDLLSTVEESMEMLGVVTFIHALLTYVHQMGIHRINLGVNLGRKL